MPFERADIAAFVAAVAAHAGIAYGLAHMPPPSQRRPSWVEVEVKKRLAPPEPKKAVVSPPPKPEPPKKVKKAPPPPKAPPPNATPPKEPPKEPPKPVFGLPSAESDANVSMPVGNTTMIDPSKSGKGPAAPLPAAPAPPRPEYKPVSELYVRKLPDIDSDACGRSIQYPAEAEQLGIEGDVKLRIELDERGKVHGIRVLSGLGHGLDQAATWALTHRCTFTPAISTDGKPVPFVIPAYVFHFEIPR